ncbi:MAG: hypothetical protein ABIK65_07695 [Candidatus Eisenbacteria bacterium]
MSERRSMQSVLALSVGLTFFPAAAGYADFIGLDRNGDLLCDPEDMAYIVGPEDVGSVDSVDVYLADLPAIFAWGCTFCVKDKSLVTDVSWTFDIPAGWDVEVFEDSENGDTVWVSPWVIANFPDRRCWYANAADMLTSDSISVYPVAVATLTYSIAEEGCLGFFIDGDFGGYFSVDGLEGTFGEPGETCDISPPEFGVVRVVGEFNNWDTSGPTMTLNESCVWVDTLTIQEGCYYMKFRTGDDWGADDYGGCIPEDPGCSAPPAGSVCQGTGGDPPAIGKILFQSTGAYEFRLDETNMTYQVTELGTTRTVSESWGQIKKMFH